MEIKNILLTHKKDIELLKEQDFINYIIKSKTINLYKDQLNDFILTNFIKNDKINTQKIGLIFTMLIMFVNAPTLKIKEIQENITAQIDNDNIKLFEELKSIYCLTMKPAYKNYANGKKGGRKIDEQAQGENLTEHNPT